MRRYSRYSRYCTIFTISNGILKTRRDKNIVPSAQFKTHLSRWVFVFIYLRTMKSAFGRIYPQGWMKSLRDEIRLRRVMVADFISPEACLGFHLNVVKISSAFADFITVGDFIFFRRPIYFSPFLWYNTTNR